MKAKGKPFHFKQFTIYQDECAMKVGTDGVLLGAWTDTTDANSILDIGTGTGLISLMLAQRAPQATITAIEIDLKAAEQAQQNFENSMWNKQLTLVHSSFQNFPLHRQFDLVVSNPPYFKSDSQNTSREIARNQAALSLSLLIEKTKQFLKPKGRLNLVLPFNQMNELNTLVEQHQLYLTKVTKVKGSPNSPVKRVLLEISHEFKAYNEKELVIELDKRHEYSNDYRDLLLDYLTIF